MHCGELHDPSNCAAAPSGNADIRIEKIDISPAATGSTATLYSDDALTTLVSQDGVAAKISVNTGVSQSTSYVFTCRLPGSAAFTSTVTLFR